MGYRDNWTTGVVAPSYYANSTSVIFPQRATIQLTPAPVQPKPKMFFTNILQRKKKVKCAFCHTDFVADRRGGCSACGAQKE